MCSRGGCCEDKATVVDRAGLHLRIASRFVTAAMKFNCEIRLNNEQSEADGRSIIQIMMLDAGHGAMISIRAEGADAPKAMVVLKSILEDHFDENR